MHLCCKAALTAGGKLSNEDAKPFPRKSANFCCAAASIERSLGRTAVDSGIGCKNNLSPSLTGVKSGVAEDEGEV